MAKPRKRLAFVPRTDVLEERRLLSVGVNVNFNTPYAGEPIWADLTNEIRSWGPYSNVWDGTTKIPVDNLNYPLVNASTFVAMGSNPVGSYQFSYQGAGTFTFSGAGHLLAPVVLGSDGVYRGTVIVDDANTYNLLIYLSNVDSTNPIHDVHLMLPGYAGTTQVYTNQFLQDLQPFSVIRTMDWTLTNNSLEQNWSARVQPGSWNQQGTEVGWDNIIALANEAHKDIWINIPALATDDYVQQLAQLIHTNLDASLNVHVEYSNETWNYGFHQYQQVLNLANANPLLDATTDFGKVAEENAYREMQISNIFSQVFGADKGRVKAELGGFAVYSNFLSIGLSYINSHFGSPSQYFSAIAIAPYIGISSSINNSGLTLNSLFASMNQAVSTSFVSEIQAHKALANLYGLSLDAYEGGQSLTGNVGGNYRVKLQAQSDPRMAQLYTTMLTYWTEYAGGSFLQYTFDEYNSVNGFWGLLQSADQPGSVKWDAVMRYILKPGDATLDGTVGWADFQILAANYGKSGRWWSQGDFDGDGIVNITDLNLLRTNLDYASLTPAQAAQIAVFGQQAPIAWNGLTPTQVTQQENGSPATIATDTATVYNGYGANYISAMSPTTVANGSGAIGVNRAANGWPLRPGWIMYANGLSVYGNSQVDVSLGRSYTTFQADVGLDAAASLSALETFQVWGDGVLLYTSPVIKPNQTVLPITVNVTGVNTLSLRTVMSGTAGATANVADWGAARVLNVPAGSSGALTWQVSLKGTVVMTTTSPSFVLRSTWGTGIYTVTANYTAGGVTASSSANMNVGLGYPGNQSATAGTGQITLNWSSSGSTVKYAIYRGLSMNSLSLYKTGVTGTTYVDTAVTPGTTYYYAFAVVSADGIQGPLSWVRYAAAL